MKKVIQGILIAFIAVVIGIVFFTTAMDDIYEQRNAWTIANETLDISTARAGGTAGNGINVTHLNLTNDDVESVVVILNSTYSEFTVTTDYVFNNTDDTINFQNSSVLYNYTDSNTTYVTYTYLPDNYVKNSTTRSILPLILLFMALGIIAVVLYAIWPEVKDMFN